MIGLAWTNEGATITNFGLCSTLTCKPCLESSQCAWLWLIWQGPLLVHLSTGKHERKLFWQEHVCSRECPLSQEQWNWWWYGCEFGQDMPRSLLDHIALDMVSNDVQVWRLGEVWLLPLQYFMPQPVTFWCTEWQIRSMLSNGLNGQTIESCRSCRSWRMVCSSGHVAQCSKL